MAGQGGFHHQGMPGHKGHFLQHHRVVHCVLGVGAPGKGPVAVHQHCRDVLRAFPLEGFHNHLAGFQLILPADLLGGHLPGAGDLPVKVVPVGGAQCGDAPAHLAENGGPPAVGVHHAPNVLKSPVQLTVGVRIRGGVPFALHFFPGTDIHQHHILRGELFILHAAGLDGHDAAFPVDPTDVAPSEGDQVVLGQQQVGAVDLFF